MAIRGPLPSVDAKPPIGKVIATSEAPRELATLRPLGMRDLDAFSLPERVGIYHPARGVAYPGTKRAGQCG